MTTETYQSRKEFLKLLAVYKKLNPSLVIEIGSLLGNTLEYWMVGMPNKERPYPYPSTKGMVISIDMMIKDENDPRYAIQKAGHEEGWKEIADACGIGFKLFEGDSTSKEIVDGVFKVVEGEVKYRNVYNVVGENQGVDFLFIDGGHEYETVKSDYENYGKMVRKGGIIAFHDITPSPLPYSKVDLFWNEVKQGRETQEFCFGDGEFGIGVLRV